MERDIDLTKIKSYVINVDSATKRFEECKRILDRLNISFERYSANTTPSPPNPYGSHMVGCSLSHLELLEKIEPGTIIFEDDIAPTRYFTSKISVPEDTDALYLGVSVYGVPVASDLGYPGAVIATQETQHLKRIYNMCSTHAILYLSKKYIDAVKESISGHLFRGVTCDVAIAHIQNDFKVLTPNNPLFYQRGEPDLTNLSLQCISL